MIECANTDLSQHFVVFYLLIPKQESRYKNSSSSNLLPLFNDGGVYKGCMENGKKEGFGKIEWKKSITVFATLTSVFHLDYAKGIGRYYTKEGIEYGGQFQFSKANGYGIYKQLNGGIYEGYWENDLQSTFGIEIWSDGTKYTGNYYQGKKHGIGTYEWVDGSKYQGQWEENALSGYGIYHFKDGRVYIGEWNDNLMNGYGEITWKDGKVYIGFIKKDKKDGFGIYLWTTKQKAFIGFWKSNSQHGLGKYVTEKSVKYGRWISGSQEKSFDTEDDFYSKYRSECYPDQYMHFFKHDYKSLDMFIKLFKK